MRLNLLVACSAVTVACTSGSTGPAPVDSPSPAANDSAKVALNDLGMKTYRGFQGGLYLNGSNSVPSDHDAAGIVRRSSIKSLGTNGNPAANGKYVLISIGMSNTTQEWCSASSALPCDSGTLMGRAAADPGVNKTTLVIVNGAASGQTAVTWATPAAANYDRIRDTRLAPLGLSEKQVQAAWVKLADGNPSSALPSTDADAYVLMQYMGNVVRAMKTRYPNLQQVFLSSRIYAGYATTALNPEPYAYESGFSVKWLIEAQIYQMRSGAQDARAGNLSYFTGVAPWLAWGPYLWADGTRARSDGLTWIPSDLSSDGTHPSQSGESKVGAALLDFFKTSPLTRCWFVGGLSC